MADRKERRTAQVQRTAQGPMVIAAVEQHEPVDQRIVDDPLVARMLSTGQRRFVGLFGIGMLRRLLILLVERIMPGAWGGFLARKRYADDEVKNAFAGGIDQLVVLGAGLDTRAARLVTEGRTGYEVDLPDNSAAKRARLKAALGTLPDRLRLVPVDFETDDLAAVLRSAGLDPDRPVIIVWEGVTQYLTESAVRATLASLSDTAPGSRLIFSYVLRSLLDGRTGTMPTPSTVAS